MSRRVFLAALLVSSFGNCLWADVSVRECILFPSTGATAWKLGANSGWTDVGSLAFNFQNASDLLVQVSIFFWEGNVPNKRVEYQIVLDGVVKTQFVRSTPDNYPTTQVSRAFIQDVLGGEHTLTIRANNRSTSPAYFRGFWISPLLVESTETMIRNASTTAITVGSAWTTVATVSIAPPADRMLFLGGYLEFTGGTVKDQVEYRFIRDGVVLESYVDSVPDSFPDGIHFAYINRAPVAGQNALSLQVRTPSGTSTTINSRSLFAHTLPKFTVFEGSGSNISFPNDDQWRTIASSGYITMDTISLGDKGSGDPGIYASDGFGFGHLTYTGTLNSEVHVRFWLSPESGVTFPNEVGVVDLHPTARTKLEAGISDWEQLGIRPSPDRYRVELQAVGLCQTNATNVNISSAKFQVMVTPDDTPYYSLYVFPVQQERYRLL